MSYICTCRKKPVYHLAVDEMTIQRILKFTFKSLIIFKIKNMQQQAKMTTKRRKITDEQIKLYNLIDLLLHSIYNVIHEFSKKKPESPVTPKKVVIINRLLEKAKELLKNDEIKANALKEMDFYRRKYSWEAIAGQIGDIIEADEYFLDD